MNKRIFSIILIIILLTSNICVIANEDKSLNMEVVDFSIDINGVPAHINNSMLMSNNRTYLPLRNIAELLMLYVVYDGDNEIIKISDIGNVNDIEKSEPNHFEDNCILADITDIEVKIDGYMKTLKSPVVTVNNRAYMPVREIAELFECKVEWDHDRKTIVINKDFSVAYPVRLWFGVEDDECGYLYGYTDENGNVKISPKYAYASEFSEGKAVVADKNYSYGYINTDGEMIIPCEYYDAEAFSEGIAPVRKDYDSVCYITQNNDVIVEYDDATLHPFHDGLGAVNYTDEMGRDKNMYIDHYGNIAADFGIEPISDFECGYAVVGEGDRCRVINNMFDVVFKGDEYEEYHLSNGYIIAKKNGKYGIVDINNNIIIDFQYDMLGSFCEGVIDCNTKNGWGFIDINNNIIIPMKYSSVKSFDCGVALVTTADKPDYICFINKNGYCTGTIYKPEFYYREASGMLRIYENDKFKYFVNSFGESVEPKFKSDW